jgi:hypothetical protein
LTSSIFARLLVARDASPHGQRFVMIKQSAAAGEPPLAARIALIQNWFEELKRRVPTK